MIIQNEKVTEERDPAMRAANEAELRRTLGDAAKDSTCSRAPG